MISTERLLRTRARARLAVAQRNALSQWTVTRAGEGEIDDETGDYTPNTETVWTGDGHFYDKTRPHVRSRNDTALTIEEPTLCVGVDAEEFEIGDTVSAVSVDDPTLMSRAWMITGKPGSSYAFHRHYPLQEITASIEADDEQGS